MSEEKDDKWEMPQPVFQSSEGSLPRSLEETISTSFMANAETIEIDEDDDILGIMDDSYLNRPVIQADSEEEPILETLPETKPDRPPAVDIADKKPVVDTVPVIQEDPAVDTLAEPPPIAVATKESAAPASGNSASNFVFLIIAALLVIAAAAYFLFKT